MLRAREIGSARIMRSRVSKAATGVGLGVALIIAVLPVRGELERWLHHRFLESTVDRAVAVVGIVGLGTVVLAFMRRANVAAAPRAALAPTCLRADGDLRSRRRRPAADRGSRRGLQNRRQRRRIPTPGLRRRAHLLGSRQELRGDRLPAAAGRRGQRAQHPLPDPDQPVVRSRGQRRRRVRRDSGRQCGPDRH